MKQYGSILHEKWEKYSNTAIVGVWAEDGSTYTIYAPEQLIDTLINMQNTLSKKYQEIKVLEASLVSLKRNMERILPEESN